MARRITGLTFDFTFSGSGPALDAVAGTLSESNEGSPSEKDTLTGRIVRVKRPKAVNTATKAADLLIVNKAPSTQKPYHGRDPRLGRPGR